MCKPVAVMGENDVFTIRKTVQRTVNVTKNFISRGIFLPKKKKKTIV